MTRLAILQAVGNRREAKAVDGLLPLLDNDDRQLADAAATALASIGDARAVEPLLKRSELYTATLLTLAARLVINDQAAAAGPIVRATGKGFFRCCASGRAGRPGGSGTGAGSIASRRGIAR